MLSVTSQALYYSHVRSKHFIKKHGRERRVCLLYDYFLTKADLKHSFVATIFRHFLIYCSCCGMALPWDCHRQA